MYPVLSDKTHSIDKASPVRTNNPMRTLVIHRHAKSSWALPGMDDFDRPLNDRGNVDAARMGAWIVEQGVKLDEILCSSAARTRATAKHITKVIGSEPPITHLDDLYLASADTIKNSIGKIDNASKTALVIGHNPGLHDVVLRLLTANERQDTTLLRTSFPTAACAIINLPITNWNDIAWNAGELQSFMVPKSLKPK